MHDLDTRLADIQRRFNDAQARKTELDAEVTELDAELFRLQGENRLLKDLMEHQSQTANGVPDLANTITAKPKDAK